MYIVHLTQICVATPEKYRHIWVLPNSTPFYLDVAVFACAWYLSSPKLGWLPVWILWEGIHKWVRVTVSSVQTTCKLTSNIHKLTITDDLFLLPRKMCNYTHSIMNQYNHLDLRIQYHIWNFYNNIELKMQIWAKMFI